MTTLSSTLSQGVQDTFDTGPLSWVIGEIREALNLSKAAIHEAAQQDTEGRATSLHHAKSYLHQAHGALQIVDVDGIAMITETVEDLLDRVEAGQLALTADFVQTISNGYQSLIEYLEELLSGVPHQPVRLFPYYRALLEARGAERIHPADLFFPNLAVRPSLPPRATPIEVPAAKYTSLRQRFERALLPFLKSSERDAELANAAAMRDIVGEIEGLQGSHQTRAFWWVMHGLAEAVSAGQINNEVFVKQIFARINLQIRRLAQGSSSIAERLLRDALFFIAKAKDPSPHAREIRNAYQLEGSVPEDYEFERYGQVDIEALASAKERLVQAKNVWNRIAGGDASVAGAFESEMQALADAVARLNAPALSKLLRELKGIARHAAHAKPGDALGLEMATSLLFIENSLSQIGRLPENFADRADAMTARLLTVVSGDRPIDSVQWLDDMSREALQRQTVAALAAEMQANLRQVEKTLDEYFRDPSHRSGLHQLDPILHQIEGALAVLDQDDATLAVQHIRASVTRFLMDEVAPSVDDFQKVAQNVGALSFFIETLQFPAENVKGRFSFDPKAGVFHAKLIEKNTNRNRSSEAADVAVEADSPEGTQLGDAGSLTPGTVEDELAFHQQQSAALALSLTAEPENRVLQEQLKASLEQIRRDAALVDNPEANDRAQAGIEILKRPDFPRSQEALAEIITATVPVIPASEALPAVVAPESEEAIDAELLEIFLLEAEEVLAAVRQTLPDSRNQPHNQEYLTTLRRSFHTLKGSSRMVGLSAFGEAAWSIEQVLNLRLSESRGGDAELYALLEKAADVLAAWVEDLRLRGRSERTQHALVAAAERVKAGGRFEFDEPQPMHVAVDAAPVLPEEQYATSELIAQHTDSALVSESASRLEKDAGDEPTSITEEAISEDALSRRDLSDLTAGDEAFVSEADAALSSNEQVISPETNAGEAANVAVPSTDMQAASEPAMDPVVSIAEVIEFPTLHAPEVRNDDNIKRIGDIEISVQLHNIYLAETDELVRFLARDISEWRHEPDRAVTVQGIHAAHSLAGSSATVGFVALQEVAHALELVLQFLLRTPLRLAQHEFDTLEQSVERIKLMLQKFALSELPSPEPEHVRLLDSLRRELEVRAGNDAASVSSTGLIESLVQSDDEQTYHKRAEVEPDSSSQFADHVGILAASPRHSVGFEELPAVSSDVMSSSGDESVADSAESTTQPLDFKDELDSDLLPVFIEEGRDLLPQLEAALRTWQTQTANPALPQSMLRLLHTLKGSARMAGAMSLGQHLHEMETGIENIMRLGAPESLAIENLLIRYDQALQMFEQLQNPIANEATGSTLQEGADSMAETAALPSAPVVLSPLMPLPKREQAVTDVPALNASVMPAGNVPMVRVRADILDRLVNQAGEVSIARSKLETEVLTLKQSLSELTENVTRLRDQLREIEMQAETQITSRMAHSADREFDPLEFDRFTRLQELTRMMAESVNDVGSVHSNLSRTLDDAAGDLLAQARLTRDLQQDLMRVRMVQFASVAERLFRVTRQTAKEVDKRVNLDIRGSTVEIDRGVLEKMIGPFEHLLRNAIVHGIEPRDERRAAGKSETGELLVEIRQEGNEVVIQFSDDGRGLDLSRIRDKAKNIGLLKNDMSDDEVTDLIFHPGFSTADEITELAGRGVGMDVVRSEAAALGGRVSTRTEPGKGTHFTIHLPLTLAVTQVVLLSAGGTTYAIPSVLVEQVQQLKTNALASAYNDGAVTWQGQRVAMHYLSALLGDKASTPIAQQYSPLMILRSGNDRVALHVDEIIGNREVVVKNIGPQLARLVGVAGATVLGSGDIVLILNPVALAQRAAYDSQHVPRILSSDALPSMGAVAEIIEPPLASSAPVQGLRTQSIVMVVDDSLTVRRVTQRLLSREGYQVVLAKDGVDALEQLQSVTPDVMLVDIEMPRMDGFDLTRNVRGDERTRHIPIIMITSRTAEKHRNYAMELGVNEYLGKPYQEERLLELIAGFVGKGAPVA